MKFKSIFLFGLILSSCVVLDKSPNIDKEIVFSSFVSKPQTRVTGEIGTTYNKEENFIVSAYWTKNTTNKWENGHNYMNQVEVSHRDNTAAGDPDNIFTAWAPDTTYYWPKDGYLSFVAFSPASIKSDNVKINPVDGKISIDYTINPNDERKYIDVLYSQPTWNKQSSTGGHDPYEGVDIVFNHALSSIWTKIATVDNYTGTIFKIKKVTYKNILSNVQIEKEVNDSAKIIANGTIMADYIAYNSGEEEFNNTPKSLTDTSSALILAPQSLSDNAEVEITYSMKTSTGTAIKQIQTVKLKTSTINEWEIGKRYIYTFKIGLDAIYFAPSVVPWDDVDTDITLN